MNCISKSFLFFMIFVFHGCRSSALEPGEYLKAANDTKGFLCTEQFTGNYKVRLFYRPSSFFAAQAGITAGNEYTNIIRQYANGYYFMVSISCKDTASVLNCSSPEKILENMEECAILQYRNNVLKCNGAIDAGISGTPLSINVLLSFPRGEGEVDRNIRKRILRIKEFGLLTGTICFDLRKINPDGVKLIGDKL